MINIDNIELRLREKGLRATAQRLMICREIASAGHIDIDHLYERLKKVIPSLSLATIYKNMHSLVDKEIVSEVNITGKKTLYEINITPHIHHICSECGHVEDIPYDTMQITQDIPELNARKIEQVKITTIGICSQCLVKH